MSKNNVTSDVAVFEKDRDMWRKDVFSRDALWTVLSSLSGKVYTIIDASIADPKQNKAMHDLVHTAVWNQTWEPLVRWAEGKLTTDSIMPFPFSSSNPPVGPND